MQRFRLLLLTVALLPVLLVSLSARAQLFSAQFDPSNGILPNPINLLFTGSNDGTLNIPNPNNISIVEALNALDGFSTVAPMTTTFSAAVDPATLIAGDSVRVFEVDTVNPFLDPTATAPFSVTQINAELIGDEDFSVNLLAQDPEQRTLVISPLKPLKPKTGYMVVLTDTIRSTTGTFPFPDLTYIFSRYREGPLIDNAGNSRFSQLTNEQAQTLEPIRKIVVSQEDAVARQTNLRRGRIILSWSFMTQSIDDVLQVVKAGVAPQTTAISPTGMTTADLGFGLPGFADIHVGTLQVPYYHQAPSIDPSVVLTSSWQGVNNTPLTRYNPQAIATQTLSIPLLATFPNAASGHSQPAQGWPVMIFQHGITRDRTDLLFVADALAAIGFVAVAIDIPLHGVTDANSPFFSNMERTFNVDLINNETSAPGPDGLIDPSGMHYINLTSLLTSRDNLRQGASDLLHLVASLPTLIAIDRVLFWGNSLGGITGGVFLGLEDITVGASALTATGGGVAKLLGNSGTFGPLIAAGLATQGLVQGTPEFEAFFRAAQQVVDSGDSINYAVAAADAHPIHLIEVIGDQTIPNSVADAPLSGTEPLATTMGLLSVSETTMDETGIRSFVRITEGGHGSPLSPAASAAATVEIQNEVLGFLASDGTVLPISNPSIVQQSEE